MLIEHHQLDLPYAQLRAADPARRRRLMAALAEQGQQVPVVVVAAPNTPGRYVLIDGYERVAALRSLKQDTLQATVWQLSTTDALLAHFHRGGGPRSMLEEAWFVEHLEQEAHLSLEEIGLRLCRSKSWVSRRLALRQVIKAELRTKVTMGLIPPHAAMRYLVPLARANAQDAQKLVISLGNQRVSTRQLGRLYAAYRAADVVGRARLVTAPRLFLKTQAEAERRDEAPPPGVDKIVQDLGVIAGVSGRSDRRVRRDVSLEELRLGRDRLRVAWRAAHAAFASLCDGLERRLENDRPRHQESRIPSAQEGQAHPSDSTGTGDLP